MTKVATYDDLLAEIEAQNAYIKRLEQEREALQKELAELRTAGKRGHTTELDQWPTHNEATEAGRVSLMDGWYVLYDWKPFAWLPTYEEADGFARENKGSNGQMSNIPYMKPLQPADFIPLREAYYANQR